MNKELKTKKKLKGRKNRKTKEGKKQTKMIKLSLLALSYSFIVGLTLSSAKINSWVAKIIRCLGSFVIDVVTLQWEVQFMQPSFIALWRVVWHDDRENYIPLLKMFFLCGAVTLNDKVKIDKTIELQFVVESNIRGPII